MDSSVQVEQHNLKSIYFSRDERLVMNIRQIEVFREIMSAGSVTEAARRLNISQPAISKHLRLMEHDLGFDLFLRKGNQLIPTVEALALIEQVEQVYTGLDSLSRFADDLKRNRHGDLTVAAMPLLAQRWLPKLVASFAKTHSNVSLSIPVRSTDWIARAVAAGTVDIGIGLDRGTEPGIETSKLMCLPLVCVCAPDHTLAGSGRISPRALKGYDLITLSNFDRWPLELDRVLEDSGALPARRLDVFTAHIACELVVHGAGVAIVDALTALDYLEQGLVLRPLDANIAFEISLMQPRLRQSSRVARAMCTIINAAAERIDADVVQFWGKLEDRP
ncbi:LysR substrate-binding domain-containing protein [Pelagibius sp. Alg239-R121]|uniref:LysR substrate-binding domain-containing protein n=1 Tax=Pelagibius sp. Alg239-R121 TaxID=2993448 RepID=UPI0024A7751A|nr:LysR substrate-binding domain-containing protein [Pelagibius sp. Alg239-R121]